jgi:hypothetical protein
MDEYFVDLRSKKELVITAAGHKTVKPWLIFLDDGGKEVARFNIGDVEGYGIMSSRPGPSMG